MKKVTVEPVLFLYMFSLFMMFPALQDLIYSKVCIQSFSETVCDALYSPGNRAALDAVQTKSSHWILWSTFTMALTSIVSAQFLGSWSDMFGHKIPMLLPPLGGMLACLLYIILSVYLHEGAIYLLLLSSFLSGICGGFTSCILTCMSYISHISSVESRTVRISLLESMTFLGGTIGPLCASQLQKTFSRDVLFTAILTCYGVVVLYIIVFVRSLPPRHSHPVSWLKDGCSFRHLRQSIHTVTKRRQEKRCCYLLLLMVCASVLMICTAGELDLSYIYVKDKPLCWNFEMYTWYFSLKYAIGAALLVMMPVFRNVADPILMIIGIISRMAGLFLLSFAHNSAMVFAVAVVAMFSTWSMPVVRAEISKLVEVHEHGRTFAFVAILENASTLVASGIFNSMYPVTRSVFHGLMFFAGGMLLLIPLGVECLLYYDNLHLSTYDRIDYRSDDEVVGGIEESGSAVLPSNHPSEVHSDEVCESNSVMQ